MSLPKVSLLLKRPAEAPAPAPEPEGELVVPDYTAGTAPVRTPTLHRSP